AALAGGGQIDTFVAGADGTDDLEIGHGRDHRGLEPVGAVRLDGPNFLDQRVAQSLHMGRAIGPVIDGVLLRDMVSAVFWHLQHHHQIDLRSQWRLPISIEARGPRLDMPVPGATRGAGACLLDTHSLNVMDSMSTSLFVLIVGSK